MEVLHLRAPRRQKLVGTGKQILLLSELVPDVPLPLEEHRFHEGPGLELLISRTYVKELREGSEEGQRGTREESTYLGDTGQVLGHNGQRCP